MYGHANRAGGHEMPNRWPDGCSGSRPPPSPLGRLLTDYQIRLAHADNSRWQRLSLHLQSERVVDLLTAPPPVFSLGRVDVIRELTTLYLMELERHVR